MNTVIKTENLSKQYQFGNTRVNALRGVDIDFKSGTYYSIMGPSGSGKSSLLNILGLLDTPSSGRLLIDGEPISNLSEKALTRLRQKNIGFIFQNFCLIPTLTAKGNVAMPLRILGRSKRSAEADAIEMLTAVGLENRLEHFPNEMSGGERQRVAIARAVVKNPRYILADEPTGNLDSKTGHDIVSILRKIVEKQGTTVIQVTHDSDIGALSDLTFTLKDGQIAQ